MGSEDVIVRVDMEAVEGAADDRLSVREKGIAPALPAVR